jgi:hypothetical protein
MIRVLCAAYNLTRLRFPVDVVVNAYDGRALGIPPLATYNSAFVLPAGTPILLSTARRFECLMKTSTTVNSFATVEFLDTRGQAAQGIGPLLQTARIPIVIS